jgi:REP element-mobilizing transposase RayT
MQAAKARVPKTLPYFAGSYGGAPIAVIRQYIEQQKTPH